MACHIVRFVLYGCTLAQAASRVESTDNFEPACESDKDYGWPRFHSQEEIKASPWSNYFLDVYGELPSKYPVCIYDFELIDKEAYHRANITGYELVNESKVKAGDFYNISASGVGWSDHIGYGIYHESWTPVPNNTWVEVRHMAFPTEMKGFWTLRTKGSGVWVNTGRSIAFPNEFLGSTRKPTLPHQVAAESLVQNCSISSSIAWTNWPQYETDIFGFCAREKGYDSVQFAPSGPFDGDHWGVFGLTGLSEMVNVNIDGKYPCGTKDESKTPLHEGWRASRHCNCKNHVLPDSCGVLPNIGGFSPRLCKHWEFGLPCDPSTCPLTKCGVRRQNHSTKWV